MIAIASQIQQYLVNDKYLQSLKATVIYSFKKTSLKIVIKNRLIEQTNLNIYGNI